VCHVHVRRNPNQHTSIGMLNWTGRSICKLIHNTCVQNSLESATPYTYVHASQPVHAMQLIESTTLPTQNWSACENRMPACSPKVNPLEFQNQQRQALIGRGPRLCRGTNGQRPLAVPNGLATTPSGTLLSVEGLANSINGRMSIVNSHKK